MMDDITLFDKRKRDMMELWKETFHDSDRYINLVFDSYFSLENSFVRYHENRLIAALLCVEYEFQILKKEGQKRRIRGLYLCGLATRPEWRRKGIMAELMKEAENDARSRGYDMTFLIPADDHLRHYYSLKGYQSASWRELKVVSGIPQESTHVPHIYSIKKFIVPGKTKFLSKLAQWCSDIDASRMVDTIVHSQKDFLTIMAENENSIFFTDTTFDPEYPILAKVRGVVFPEVSDDSEDSLKIVGLYMRRNSHEVSEQNNQDEISIVKKEEEKFVSDIHDSILRWFDKTKLELLLPYSGKYCHECRVEPYAMTKFLNQIENFSCENENPLIEISLMLD